ncbi:TRAP transporter small permease [Celeribacter litoreus]|uniref:TRAP transporter small permease n=1 Tax=Celeribacter litoreus TaxID=2876714 RepID=UPI001CCFD294|nr:TRAP transporter small permease [Celeribacter litoreus]MCA0042006.1 TRAP transporter small permease [Celeribacter litoreus]
MSSKRLKKVVSTTFLAGAGACFLFGTGVTVGDVALRAVASKNIPGAIELTSLSIGLGALLSMPVCYAKRTHVTAKLLSEISPNRFTYPLGLVGAIASTLFAILLLWIVGENALEKIGSPETTADLGLPIPVLIAIIALALAACFAAALAGLRYAFINERDW